MSVVLKYLVVCLVCVAAFAVGAQGFSIVTAAGAQEESPSPEQLWDAYPLDPEGDGQESTTDPAPTPTPNATGERPAPDQPATPPAESNGGPTFAALALFVAFAFAIGLAAGHIVRRRRATEAERLRTQPALAAVQAPVRRSNGSKPKAPPKTVKPPPPPTPAPEPVRRAPPEPEPIPAPAPPPPEPAPRTVKPPPPPPPAPEPLRVAPPEPEPEPEPVAAPDPSLRPSPSAPPEPERVPEPVAAQPAAEVAAPAPAPPRRRRIAPERPLPVKRARPPLGYSPAAPERPLPPRRRPQPPPQQDEPLLPGRRFARAVPWPEAESEWTCEIDWKAGYRKSAFRAMAAAPGPGRRRPIAESTPIRWTLMAEPEPPTPEMVKAVKAIVAGLEAAGWERTGAGGAWYALRFLWRGSGEPQRIDIHGREGANA